MSPDPARVPVYPHRHLPLARDGGPLWLHAAELAACLALGQRALIVGPSRSGKTTLLQEVAQSIRAHVPDAELFVVIVDQPLEEFLEWRMLLPGVKVHGSSSDDGPEQHVALGPVFEQASEVAANGGDAVVLVDSLASLARALNVTMEEDERVLTGGLMATALRATRGYFGLGRALEPDGSLTIIATAAIETELEMDDVVFHELVGTGNVELHLSAEVRDAGIFPPLDIERSGARHTEEIVGEGEARKRGALRAQVAAQGPTAGLALLLGELERTRSLAALLEHTDVD